MLLLSGLPARASAAGRARLAAIFIVARRVVSDPFFADSTVLVMNDAGPAPVGVIIDKPTSIAVAELFPRNKRLAGTADTLYFGGPVRPRTLWFLFRAAEAPAHAIAVCRGLYLSANETLLLRLLARSKPMRGLRIYLGHASWAPGQLESEIDSGAWTLKRVDPRAIFGAASGAPRTCRPPAGKGLEQTHTLAVPLA